jgi:hypothetical protein
MADTAPQGETPTQLAARLRREKRQAKIAATGEDRLNKIKGLNGGVAPPEEVLGGPAVPIAKASSGTQARAPQNVSVADDPDEVDISDYSYTGTPRSGANGGTGGGMDEVMRQMMQMQGQSQGPLNSPQQGGAEDPMAQMLQQLMGSMGGDPNGQGGPGQGGDLPAMLSTMLGGGQTPAAQPASGAAYIWRIVHAVVAFGLATYISLFSLPSSTPFTGSKLSRFAAQTPLNALLPSETGTPWPKLFYLFITTELGLQSTRWMMEKGRPAGSGILLKIANSGFVPQPYAHYIRTFAGYLRIFSTVMADAMVVVFVLGMVAWWRGG